MLNFWKHTQLQELHLKTKTLDGIFVKKNLIKNMFPRRMDLTFFLFFFGESEKLKLIYFIAGIAVSRQELLCQ
jgi:hypothetical protein